MPIIESRIDKIEPQRPGLIRVHEFFRDHTGFETTNIYDVPEGYDTAQHLADAVVFRDANAIESEADTVEARVLEGEDPALITVDHITDNDRLVFIVKAFMLGAAHEIRPTAEYIDTSVSNSDLTRAVGATRRVMVRDRVTSVLDLRAALDADEELRDG